MYRFRNFLIGLKTIFDPKITLSESVANQEMLQDNIRILEDAIDRQLDRNIRFEERLNLIENFQKALVKKLDQRFKDTDYFIEGILKALSKPLLIKKTNKTNKKVLKKSKTQ